MPKPKDKIIQSSTANQREQIRSPEIIQSDSARRVADDPDKIKVAADPSTIPAYRFVQISSYNTSTKIYTVIYPSLAYSGLNFVNRGELAITDMLNPTYAYIGGCHKVTVRDDAEDLAVGDPCGSDTIGKAIKGGPYIVMKVDGSYVWVVPN